ncbi:bis-aminopropyl spermidine synthase family protein [Mangrovicella endophytica]|uniref:bis-aminopropyl spermidine synthase family protein n=1 Tax=Mangrovicella endophytica TaxID=2066697 RepID=UPI000C9E26EB|nr:bis-aminopropyl spermidine synthase family protein [Mangrovicella endophytica]
MTDMPAAKGDALLARIAEATSLREGREGVAAILRAIHAEGPLPLNVLARLVRIPLPVVGAVRRELETAGLLVRGGGVALSSDGERFAADTLGLSPRPSGTPGAAASDGVPPQAARTPRPERPERPGRPVRPRLQDDAAGADLDDRLKPLLPLMEVHAADGPPVDVTLDQAPCTPETALRRAFAMHQAGALAGRRILLLGDDDSISVALSLIARAIDAAPRRLSVLELDPGRIAHLERARERHGLAFEITAHDLRKPLPEGFKGAFDTAETDPPYTLEGASLFLSRGIEALLAEPNLPVFLSYADLSPDDMLALQMRLNDLGLAATRIRPSFNTYGGASILGGVGQLIELRTTRRTRSEIVGEAVDGPIYTGEVRPRRRSYRCRTCGTIVPVGTGERFTTIEALKDAGCPTCGDHVFSRQRGGGAAG